MARCVQGASLVPGKHGAHDGRFPGRIRAAEDAHRPCRGAPDYSFGPFRLQFSPFPGLPRRQRRNPRPICTRGWH